MTVLSERALVLNGAWAPITTITIKGAIILLCRGKAHVVCPETYTFHTMEQWIELSKDCGEDGIHSTNFVMRKPEIILIRGYSKFPKRRVGFTKNNLHARDNFTCQYCAKKIYQKKPSGNKIYLSVDHIIPLSKNGADSYENCVTACNVCNNKKGARLPEEAGMALIKRPKAVYWSPILNVKAKDFKESWKKVLDRNLWPMDHGSSPA